MCTGGFLFQPPYSVSKNWLALRHGRGSSLRQLNNSGPAMSDFRRITGHRIQSVENDKKEAPDFLHYIATALPRPFGIHSKSGGLANDFYGRPATGSKKADN
jgi:hypothetical protein